MFTYAVEQEILLTRSEDGGDFLVIAEFVSPRVAMEIRDILNDEAAATQRMQEQRAARQIVEREA